MKENTLSTNPLPRTGGSLETQIAEHPFLKGLTVEQLQLLTECAMPSRFASGEVIFREGDPANRFYLIQQGKVALESPVPDRPSVRIGVIGPGDVLGWSWLFPPYYWHLDARAIEPTTAIFFYGTRLREECEQNHDLGYNLMKRMAAIVIERLQATRRELVKTQNQSR
jgi:CRP-like cAMP-binding protein